jgi:hypothetical protein
MIPITILFAGTILSYIQSKYRKAIGAVLVLSGSLELCLWLILTKSLSFSGVPIYLVTIITGIGSLLLANGTIKN